DLRAVEYITGAWVIGGVGGSQPRRVAFLFWGGGAARSFLVPPRPPPGPTAPATSQSREGGQVGGGDAPPDPHPALRVASRLAAAGGALLAVIVAIQPEMGGVWTFKSFLVIVLGGAGNYPGALLGGLLLGLVEQVSALFLTSQLSEVVAYVLLVLVLLVRPSG